MYLQNLSRNNSSPDNDFVDVEGGHDRPMSAASGSSMHRAGPSIIPAQPEIKRGRGRPRKNRDNLADGKYMNVRRTCVCRSTATMLRLCTYMLFRNRKHYFAAKNHRELPFPAYLSFHKVL